MLPLLPGSRLSANVAAVLSASFSAPSYLVGDYAGASVRIHNAGTEAFMMDWEESNYAEELFDPVGRPVESVDVSGGGAFRRAEPLPPGQEAVVRLAVSGIFWITRPGTYRLRIEYPKWKRRASGSVAPMPAGACEATIQFVMPTPEQAREVVQWLERGFGFQSLHTPIYVGPLLDLAQERSVRATFALGGIRNPAAVAALTSLLQSPDENIVDAATLSLARLKREWH